MTGAKHELAAQPPSTIRENPLLYTRTFLDRTTGDINVEPLGDWIPVTELGARYGVGRKKVRAILHHMGVLHKEGERYRLPPVFVAMGYGKRHDGPQHPYPFDVLSPVCQAMIAEVWDETLADYEADRQKGAGVPEAMSALSDYEANRSRPLETQEQVCWLLDHFSEMPLSAVAQAIEADLGLVSRYAKVRRQQLDSSSRRVETKAGVARAILPTPRKGTARHHFSDSNPALPKP